MFVRSGYLIGSVRAGSTEAFNKALAEEFLPQIRNLPGVVGARLLFSRDFEDGAPGIHAVFDITYESRSAMEAALASPQRQKIRASFARIMTDFDGIATHINSDAIGWVE